MDTAQPLAAAETDPNAQIDAAKNAFLAFDNPGPARDEGGRFVGEPAEEPDEPEESGEAGDEAEYDDDTEADEEAAEPAQPLPPSWPEDMADQWTQLPADTQAFLANREAERERAVNTKFQESANARKSAELAAREAQTKREDYLAALETVEALYRPAKPDPRAFGYGTQQYNAAGYNVALAEYEQRSDALAQFTEQREHVRKQAETEEAQAFTEWKQQHEAEYAPKFLADVPDLKDAGKAEGTLRSLVDYAIANGIPDDVFSEEQQTQVTSAQLHILWKAQQFDKLRTAPAAPKPRQAGPAVRPGVSSPRSATKAARYQKATERLAREGSVEAGAAVFRHLFKE